MKYLLVFSLVFFQTPDWKSLDEAEFKVKYPGDWELNQTGIAGTKFILFMPSAQPVTFRDNINLIIQDLKGRNMDLKQFAELSKSQVKQFITNANVMTSETSADGQKHKIVYSGSQGQMNLKWQQYYWVKNEKAYILTFTTDQNSFDKRIAAASQVMDSFAAK
jgi:serine/threonine-protein kinase